MLFLSIALFIYVFYRTDKTVINQIILLFVSTQKFAFARESVTSALPLPNWVLFSMPEALWVFCATLLSIKLYFKICKLTVSCVYIPIGFAILWEIFQLNNVTNGYFDTTDLLLCTIAFILPICFYNKQSTDTYFLKPLNIRSVLFIAIFGIVYLSHVV
jgi:hypothetical protein